MNRPSNRTFQVAAALASLLALTTLGLMGSSCQKLKAPQACRTSAGSSETAEARTSADWLQKHERFVSAAANRPIELLFVGDSITAYWANEGQEVWARSFDGSRSDRFGIPGDEPKHLLARLDSGELVTPNVLKAVVLLIGTNSLSSDSATRIAAGSTAAVE